jgi:hypothetical protein
MCVLAGANIRLTVVLVLVVVVVVVVVCTGVLFLCGVVVLYIYSLFQILFYHNIC